MASIINSGICYYTVNINNYLEVEVEYKFVRFVHTKNCGVIFNPFLSQLCTNYKTRGQNYNPFAVKITLFMVIF